MADLQLLYGYHDARDLLLVKEGSVTERLP